MIDALALNAHSYPLVQVGANMGDFGVFLRTIHIDTGHLFLFSAFVKVRDHPVMHPQGYQNWPPLWTLTQKDKTKTLTGEVGVLTYVYANDRVSTKCYLVMNHEQEHYIGCMTFDDRSFCTKFVALLRKHIGHSIKEIGELEI